MGNILTQMQFNISKIILFICLSISSSTLLSQTQSVDSTAHEDSVQSIEVDKAISLLHKADSIRIADSIHKEVLRKQLVELRTNERSRRKKLEKELRKITLQDSLNKVSVKKEIDSLRSYAKGYLIAPYEDTIYVVYTKAGTLTASERADVIRERLDELYVSFFPLRDSLEVIDHGKSVEIAFHDKILMSITEPDAMWYNQSQMEIAQDIAERITLEIPIYQKEKGLFSIIKKVGLVLLIIVMQVVLIKLLNYFFRSKVNILLWSKRGVWFHGIKVKDYEVLDPNKQTSAIIFMSKIVRYIIIAILLYLTIPLIFSIFPPTKRFAELMFGYILSPVKNIVFSFIDYIPELVTIVVIVVITRYFVRFVRYLSKEVEQDNLHIPGFYGDWAKPTFNILRILIYAFMFVMIFPYLPGSDSAVFKGVSVFLGLVFSLGSSSVIGNIVAGLVITYMRPFVIGDRIKIGEVVGNVVEKTPFVIRIRTPKKEFITIPNSNILASNVINYSRSKQQGGLIIHTTVTIGYDVPWRKVHNILINAAKKTSYLNMDIAPFVLQTSLDDFYVSYQVNAHTNEPDKQPLIYSELHQNIQDGFNDSGIEILSPHYRADRDGNEVTIPKEYWNRNEDDVKS